MRNVVPVFLGAAAVAIAALGTTPVSLLAFQPVASNSCCARNQRRRGPAFVDRHYLPLLFDSGNEDNQADQKNKMKNDNVGATTTTTNSIETAAWYAVETFGKVFGNKNKVGNSKNDEEIFINTGPPQSLAETKRRLQRDNDQSYFLSGQVDAEIYDRDCVFADPFVAFTGRDRFVTNLQNLGSFITQYEARPLQYNDDNDDNDNNNNIIAVTTKFMVKLELNLPWKPVLAWPWGVRCVIDPTTYLIVRHEESWDIAPLEGVQQIFRKPTVKLRRNNK